MDQFAVLQDLLVIFGIGLIAVVLFHRLRLPAVLAFLVTGVVCGPYGFKFVDDVHSIESLAEIGVVLLLFTLGIEFSIPHFMKMKRFLLLGGFLQVGLTMAAVIGAAWYLKMPLMLSIFVSMLLSVSSTALVLRILEHRREIDSAHGRNALTILIFQDLCIVPMVLITPFLGGQEVEVWDLAWIGVKALLFLGITFTLVRYCLPWVLASVAQTRKREAFVLSIIFVCLGTAWATAHVGLSMALGAFVAGLVLSESRFSHQALGEVVPFREVFNCLVFVSIGMLFDIRALIESPQLIATGLVVVIVGKAFIAAGVTRVLGHSLKVSILTGLALSQVSEFSFVLGKLGLAAGVIDQESNQIFLSIAILSMILSPPIVAAGPYVAAAFDYLTPKRWSKKKSASEVQDATQSLNDHVIIVGYGLKGRHLAEVLRRSKIPHVILDSDPSTVRIEERKGTPINYGDATSQEVLEHLGIKRAKVFALTIGDPGTVRRATAMANRLNPSTHIVAIARDLIDMEVLIKIGADEVVPAEYVASVDLFRRVLQRYFIPTDTVDGFVKEVLAEFARYNHAVHQTYWSAHGPSQVPFNLVMAVYRAEEGSSMVGKSLAESRLRERCGATVVAIQPSNGSLITNPPAASSIGTGDSVLVLGHADQVAEAALLFKTANPS